MNGNKEVIEKIYRDMCTMPFTVHWVRVGDRLGIRWVEVVADKVVANKDLLVRSEAIRAQIRVVVVDTSVDAFIGINEYSEYFDLQHGILHSNFHTSTDVTFSMDFVHTLR